MAIGKVGSYATDKPVNDTIGDAMKYTEQMAFKYREEDAKAKALKKAEEDVKLKDYSDWDGKFDPKIIGNSSIDDPLIGMAMKAKQRAADINRELYAATDFNKKAALMSERNKLLQSFDIANQTPVLIKQKVKDLQEGIEAGKYNSRDVDFIGKIAKNLETGKYELDYNDRGVASVKIYDTDENGKPTGVLKETSLGDLANAFQPKLAFSYEKYKDDTLKNVKPDEFGTQKGAVIIEGKRISPKNIEQSKTYADVIINDPNKIYEAQFLFNEKDPEKLRIKLEKDFLTSIPEGQTQKLDSGMLNYGLAKKAADKDQVKITDFKFDNARKDDFVNIVVDPKTVYTNGISFTKPIGIANLGGENSGLNMVQVLGFTKDKATGDLVFTGKALKTKNAKFVVGGQTVNFETVQEMAANNNPEAQAALASYNVANNYGNFTRRLPSEDEANVVLGAVGLDYAKAIEMLEKKNPTAKKSTTKPKANTQDDFNAKWAKLNPGESLVGPDGKTYKKK
jgi:hypothetical protein